MLCLWGLLVFNIKGCVLTQQMKLSSSQKTAVHKCYGLLLSGTLDHTCMRANHCIDSCLKQQLSKEEPLTETNLVSDAAGHVRGFENLYHHCVWLSKERQRRMNTQSKRCRTLKRTIKTLQDLKWWIDDCLSEPRKRDDFSKSG